MLPGASTLDIKKHIQECFNSESFDEKIIFMSMFNDTQLKPGHWCFVGPASENTCCKRDLSEPQAQWDTIALQMVDIFKCYTSHPVFPATEPLSLGQLRKGGITYHFQGTFDNNKLLNKTILGSSLQCVYRSCQRYVTENQVPAPRTAEDAEQIDLEPNRFTSILRKQRNMPQARRDSMLQL